MSTANCSYEACSWTVVANGEGNAAVRLNSSNFTFDVLGSYSVRGNISYQSYHSSVLLVPALSLFVLILEAALTVKTDTLEQPIIEQLNKTTTLA